MQIKNPKKFECKMQKENFKILTETLFYTKCSVLKPRDEMQMWPLIKSQWGGRDLLRCWQKSLEKTLTQRNF